MADPTESTAAPPAAPLSPRDAALAAEAEQQARNHPDDFLVEPEPEETTAAAEEPPARTAPTLDELPALIEARKAARLADEQRTSERQELETLRAQAAAAKAPVLTAENYLSVFEAASIEQKRTWLREMYKSATQTQAEKALDPRIAELDQKVGRVEAAEQRRLEEAQAAQRAANEADFLAATEDAGRWPTLAALSPEERLEKGYAVAQRYRDAGIEVGDDVIADEAEKIESARIERILAARRGTQKGEPPATDSLASNGGPATQTPVSLTNTHAASAKSRAPTTMAERREAALRFEQRQRLARQG